jgi:hypothetical protein
VSSAEEARLLSSIGKHADRDAFENSMSLAHRAGTAGGMQRLLSALLLLTQLPWPATASSLTADTGVAVGAECVPIHASGNFSSAPDIFLLATDVMVIPAVWCCRCCRWYCSPWRYPTALRCVYFYFTVKRFVLLPAVPGGPSLSYSDRRHPPKLSCTRRVLRNDGTGKGYQCEFSVTEFGDVGVQSVPDLLPLRGRHV